MRNPPSCPDPLQDPIPRPSARIVLLDPDDRILLFLYLSPQSGRRYWITPGGAVDDGESYEAAALRELHEETCLDDVPLGPCVWTRDHVMAWVGSRFLMLERFFVVRVPEAVASIDVSGLDAFERVVLPEHRWWSLDDLERAEAAFGPDETLQPPGLVGLLRDLLSAGAPPEPIALPA